MLILDGPKVRKLLADRELELCDTLENHLRNNKELRAGVTIRPGPELDTKELVRRLRSNVQYGALNATCFLLIQNCRSPETGTEFRLFARSQRMHAANVVWVAEGPEHDLGTEYDLDEAIRVAILTMCSDPLPESNISVSSPA